jgi:hypothetical protein
VIWDCVKTTKDSFDLGLVGDEVILEGLPFLDVGMTRLTSGVAGL